ncbi:unnamed protein product [Notodromas monacha]|uniref:Uncharacterized protein n=1 Tax=Notodromas monacha TaxID=399045 RepID=A0A7R9BEV5_9CRUS|nr:unnamed protein product [Notodromas monacha]CAG0914097.1 unnamed protein product [Notodromas monacha]
MDRASAKVPSMPPPPPPPPSHLPPSGSCDSAVASVRHPSLPNIISPARRNNSFRRLLKRPLLNFGNSSEVCY